MPTIGSCHKRGGSIALTGSPSKSPVKIPLNDDAQEKAKRLQSRQALHGIQLNQIKAAASPARRLVNFEKAGSLSPPSNPKTPQRISKANDIEHRLLVVGRNPVTPMKRVPLLANFEEWMKMATDNKINATNSWNFALIDYFHDLSLLKEGESVNFQKASCTLDGCVKIYTSRVDSVATETGKLLSGLADSYSKKVKQKTNDDVEESEAEVEGEDGVNRKRPKKKNQGSSEITLASSFESLRLKKFELEFSVDPLFKKVSADFDEAGANGLLLNHLSIDCHGRIVFDSSDDVYNLSEKSASVIQQDLDLEVITKEGMSFSESDMAKYESDEQANEDSYIESLGIRFFPNLDTLDDLEVCPSLKNFDLTDSSTNINNIPFLKISEDTYSERVEIHSKDESHIHSIISIDDNLIGFNDNGLIENSIMPIETSFGEGGETWARNACVETREQVHDLGIAYHDGIGDGGDISEFKYKLDSIAAPDFTKNLPYSYDDILKYFEEGTQRNWAGPEHWRIRKVNRNKRNLTSKTKKEKQPFEIDFALPIGSNLTEVIFTQTSSKNVISMPKKERRSKNKNILPDDKHFSAKQLLNLFLKPNKRSTLHQIGGRLRASPRTQTQDDSSSAREWENAFFDQREEDNVSGDQIVTGNYDADFFQDNEIPKNEVLDRDVVEYVDAQSHQSPCMEVGDELDTAVKIQDDRNIDDGAFGNTLKTQNRRLRPDYVQYARVAKKVDVRKLKEELWKGISRGKNQTVATHPIPGRLPTPDDEVITESEFSLKFTSIIKNLQEVYSKQAINDISTSYCFICLLHLANEKGLILKKYESLTDLEIMRDETYELSTER